MIKYSLAVLLLIILFLTSCNNIKDEELLNDIKTLIKCDSVFSETKDSSKFKICEIYAKGGNTLNNRSVKSEDIASISALILYQKLVEIKKDDLFDFIKIKFQRDTSTGKYYTTQLFSKQQLKLVNKHIKEVTDFNDVFVSKDYNRMFKSLNPIFQKELGNVELLKNVCVQIDSLQGSPVNSMVYGFKFIKSEEINTGKKGEIIVFKTEIKRDSILTNLFEYVKPNDLLNNNIIGLKF